MDAVVRTGEGRTTVAVLGEIDMSTVHELRTALDEALATKGPVDIDLSRVTFMGSEGLRELSRAELSAQQRGTPLQIVRASTVVQRVLDITGVMTGPESV